MIKLKNKKLLQLFKSSNSAKTRSKPKSRLFRPVKGIFLGKATLLFLTFSAFFLILTYLSLPTDILDWLLVLMMINIFATLLFAIATIIYYLIKLFKILFKKTKQSKNFHRLQQKIKAMDKRPIFAGFIILLSLAIWLLPAFIYNRLEWKFRGYGSISNNYFNNAEDGIYIRQQSGASSYYDTLFWVADKIEELLVDGLEQMAIAQTYNDRQRWWLIFLNQDYNDYHQAKIVAYDRYYQSRQQFLRIKEQEHLRSNTIYLLNKLNEQITELLTQAIQGEELTNILEDVERIEINRQRLFEEQLIDEGINQFIEEESAFFAAYYNVLVDFSMTGDVADFDMSVYEIRPKYDETIIALFEKNADEYVQRSAVVIGEMKKNLDEFYEVLFSYTRKDLNLDQISKLLSLFRDDYPRVIHDEQAIEEYEQSKNVEEEDNEMERVPFEGINELVG